MVSTRGNGAELFFWIFIFELKIVSKLSKGDYSRSYRFSVNIDPVSLLHKKKYSKIKIKKNPAPLPRVDTMWAIFSHFLE